MPLLGAQLDDLAALGAQLDRTTAAIGDCQVSSTRATTTVVDTVRAAAADVLNQVRAQMDGLRGSVESSRALADGALWTGANAERFRGAYATFDASIRGAEQATTETYESFRRSIDEMTAALGAYVEQLAGSLTEAAASTQSMATAVEGQRANLDAVMNSGLSVA